MNVNSRRVGDCFIGMRAKFIRRGVLVDLGEVINIKEMYFYLVNIM